MIFGPADVKNKLESMLQKQSHLKSKIVGVETADSMTENQMIAWTKKYFKESN